MPSSSDTQEAQKQAAGRHALRLLTPGRTVGVGSGSTVARFIEALAGRRADFPRAVSSSERSTHLLREGFVTDNGNLILDAAGLQIADPLALESQLNQWPGVVTVGLFARRRADVLLVAGPGGVVEKLPPSRDAPARPLQR